MPRPRRSHTVLLLAAAICASGAAAAAFTFLLLEAWALAAPSLVLPSSVRCALFGLALLFAVPYAASAVLRSQRPSTDFLSRR
jgi:hypothetical protein